MKSFVHYFIFIFIYALNIIEIRSDEYFYMENGVEKNYTNLMSDTSYHYSIQVEKEDKVEFQIKLDPRYSTKYFNLTCFGDTSTKPTSKIEDVPKITLQESNEKGFLIIKTSYLVSKPFIYYVSFIFKPEVNMDKISIKITKESTKSFFTGTTILIIIVCSALLFLILLCIICQLCKKCKGKSRKKEIINPITINEYNNVDDGLINKGKKNNNDDDINTDLI